MSELKAKIQPTWMKVEDLLPTIDRKPFRFDPDKTYSLLNDSGYAMQLCVSKEAPVGDIKDSILFRSLNKACYVKDDQGDLYAKFDLPVRFPYPSYLTLRVSEATTINPELALGAYVASNSDDCKKAVRFKGSVANTSELPSDAQIGDMYDVQDTGMNVVWTGSSWDEMGQHIDTKDLATKEDVTKAIAEVDHSAYVDKTTYTEKVDEIEFEISGLATKEELENKADKTTVESQLESLKEATATITSLTSRMNSLEDRLSNAVKSDIEEVQLDDGTAELNDVSKDYVLKGNMESSLSIQGRSVALKAVTLSNNARLSVSAQGETEMSQVQITGDYPKASGNAIVHINDSDYVTIRDAEISATAYNVLEIGLSSDTNLPKGILIDNCRFTGHFTNNAISIFGTKDNAVVNINNCHFEDVSNILRLSNRLGSKVTINITNCTCNKWEAPGQAAGMIVCQDYTSSSISAASKNNLFGPEKVCININNFTCPNGSKLRAPESMNEICGSANENQIIYVYRDKGGYVAYSEDAYPQLNIN